LARLFAITLFVSAALLFWIQPLVAKMLLPLLGGTPAVWNTCLLFFQGMLLAGYAYVMLTLKWLGLRRQMLLHIALLFLAILCLPIHISETVANTLPVQADPTIWLLSKLLRTVGLPFFVLSASAPLLQKWFSHTRHAAADDPYFLYAASNAGSLIALVGFPFLLEPHFRLLSQSALWASGYSVLLLLMLGCAVMLWRTGAARIETEAQARPDVAHAPVATLTIKRRLHWLMLAFIPSSLMLGVTTYITTDIAATPLLWLIPLSLYLLSFVLVFAKRPSLSQQFVANIFRAAAVVITLVFLSGISEPIWLLVLVHLCFFFLAAIICHGQLAAGRPATRHLTEFYLWIAVGGVLGGIFNALLAPMLFNKVLEYPLVIVLVCAMLPRGAGGGASAARTETWRAWRLDVLVPLGIGALAAALTVGVWRIGLAPLASVVVALGVPLTITYFLARRPLRFALGIGAIMLGSLLAAPNTGRSLYAGRNFYGSLRVIDDPSGPAHMLYHGSTMHGWQFTEPGRRCEPLSYYHRKGPLGAIFGAFNAQPATPNVAVVGLGAGGMMPYAQAGQKWTFYEINPAVLSLAQDSRYFTYLRDCAATPAEIILGDARLQLQHAPDGYYGLIVLDAFNSDAIPVHLLTREALALYMSKLADRGQLAIHISNRCLNLRPVVGDLAKNANLSAFVLDDSSYDVSIGKAPSEWVVLARSPSELGSLLRDRRWRPLRGRPQPKVWTDDFSDIISVFKWRG
jgi:hypothetical protein